MVGVFTPLKLAKATNWASFSPPSTLYSPKLVVKHLPAQQRRRKKKTCPPKNCSGEERAPDGGTPQTGDCLWQSHGQTRETHAEGGDSSADAQMTSRSIWTLGMMFLAKPPEHKCKPGEKEKSPKLFDRTFLPPYRVGTQNVN